MRLKIDIMIPQPNTAARMFKLLCACAEMIHEKYHINIMIDSCIETLQGKKQIQVIHRESPRGNNNSWIISS